MAFSCIPALTPALSEAERGTESSFRDGIGVRLRLGSLSPQAGLCTEFVIPGRRAAVNPKSIPEACVYEFRVRGLRPRPGMTVFVPKRAGGERDRVRGC